jgi:Domain of unknown function (DUF4082)/Secretion system C-terminal sorting domain
VFQPTAAPAGGLLNDGLALQLGMKFRSSVNGTVTGVRFYKHLSNTGTHIGQLYNITGDLLASATFTSETASGWQQVNFASPVAITANATYIVSYHSSAGNYQADDFGFAAAITRGPLTGLQNGFDGPNGVYRYSPAPAYPGSNYRSSNYFVDVVFNPSAPAAEADTAGIAPDTAGIVAAAPAARLAMASPKAGSLRNARQLEGLEGVEVNPNPFSDRATVHFVLARDGAYLVGLYDAQGKLVRVLQQGQAKAGELQAIEVDGTSMASGLYLVRLQTSTGASAARLLLSR